MDTGGFEEKDQAPGSAGGLRAVSAGKNTDIEPGMSAQSGALLEESCLLIQIREDNTLIPG